MAKNPALSQAQKEILSLIENQILPQAEKELRNGTNIIQLAADFVTTYDAYETMMVEYTNSAKTATQLYNQEKKFLPKGAKFTEDLMSAKLDEAIKNARLKYQEIARDNDIATKLFEVYHKAKAFQSGVQEVQGTSIRMVFIINGTGAQPPRVFDITDLALEDVLHLDRAAISKGGAATLRFNDFSANQLLNMGAKELKEDKYQSQLNNLMAEISRRIKIAKEPGGSGGTYLMYRHGKNEWQLVKINTLGDIGEAYANLLINYQMYNKTEDWLLDPDYDKQIDHFVNDFLLQVDNQSGFFIEDITSNHRDANGDLISYGAKTGGAQMMGLKAIYTFAQLILGQNGVTTIASVKAFGSVVGGTKRNKLATINDEIGASLDEMEESMLQDLLNQLKSQIK